MRIQLSYALPSDMPLPLGNNCPSLVGFQQQTWATWLSHCLVEPLDHTIRLMVHRHCLGFLYTQQFTHWLKHVEF